MGWFRTVGIYLACQLAVFALIKWIFRTPWGVLLGPYLAFAGSITGTVFMAWLINNKLDLRTVTPRQFAMGGGLCAAFLLLSADGAFAYLGLVLGLIGWELVGDWTNWAFVVLPLTLFASVGTYRIAYRNAKIRLSVYS